jgi:DNA (cytosine-5)-methyltransferase 3A
MLKFLIGGSPCVFWSIAQNKNRETEAQGLGWELFRNFLVAKEKFNPDFFLYENNKSIATPIKTAISDALGVPLQYINSALVSAQKRERFYAHNFGDIPQPEDRGILLEDILESGVSFREKSYCLDAHYYKGGNLSGFDRQSGKRLMVAEPVGSLVRIGTAERQNGKHPPYDSKAYRVYSAYGKSVTLCGNSGGGGAYGGLYACPVNEGQQVYEVKGGFIEIKGKSYPIKLADGFYVIRKLSVTECERLMTLPDGYCRAVSASQGYKALGNGWVSEIIIHLLSYALKGVPKNEDIVVLSLYDGISTGRYCFDKLGYRNIRYFSYEIDKYAIIVSKSNYPDIIQCGDAFAVRDNDWSLGKLL